MKRGISSFLAPAFLIVLTLGLAATVEAAVFNSGDIFAAVGDANLNGQAEIFHYRADGTFVETLEFGPGIGGRSTGMAFDASGRLYATAFDASKIVRFDTQGNNLGVFIGAGLAFPESIVFENLGNFYISSVQSPVGIKKFDATGNPIGTSIAGTRVDWMDLAADQQTMFFGQETSPIFRVNVATGTLLANFVATGGSTFALRLLADGSVLVANGANIKLYDATADLVRTYDVTGENLWFALNVNPDGTSFWSGALQTGNLYEFDIACGGAVNCTTFTQFIATGVPDQQPTRALAGLAIFGEPTQGCPSCTFLCYRIKDSQGNICSAEALQNVGAPCEEEEDCGGQSEGNDETDFCVPKGFPKGVQVSLSDQFENGLFDVQKPASLCNPASKDGGGITDPDTHLKAYQIKLTKGQCIADAPQHANQGASAKRTVAGPRPRPVSVPCSPSIRPSTTSLSTTNFIQPWANCGWIRSSPTGYWFLQRRA